ncbi:hypothetical protein X943_003093 [Babesia divergens]|uniref:Uncharacterized protein n=1 Tax=Babesia divergens TaxID=32595 RepID=A0AAD9LGB4_BABDI|nr:hypothetical protein X943_003093 [Babesia divergens]
MAKQRIMPRTGEQQIKKNALEIPWSVMLKALLNLLGNSLGSLGSETGSLLGKASLNKPGGLAIMPIVSEPLVEHGSRGITLIVPLPSLDSLLQTLRTHEIKVIKRSVGLRQTLLKGLSNL